jgi:hypothetical protein
VAPALDPTTIVQSEGKIPGFVDDLALVIPEVHGEVRIPPSPLGG